MSTKPVIKHQRLALSMMGTTLIAGLMGFVFQLMPDGTMLTFLVGIGAIGGLAGSSQSFDERENQLLWKSYSKAFEYLFFLIYLVFGWVVLSGWLNITVELVGFLNGHWIGLMASTMCTVLGIVGILNFREVK